MSTLEKLLHDIRSKQQHDLTISQLEPEIDERNLPDGSQLREEEALENGGVLKAVLTPGESDAGKARDGNVIFLDYTIQNSTGELIESTLEEHGGPGHPRPFILNQGKNSRTLRGIELAVVQMEKGERAILEIKPEFAYLHHEFKGKIPKCLKENEVIKVDLTLVSFFSAGQGLETLGEGDIIRLVLQEGEGWESPREPFDVTIDVIAKSMHPEGDINKGEVLFKKENLSCSIGDHFLPPGLEAAVCEMKRGEKSVIWCPAHLASINVDDAGNKETLSLPNNNWGKPCDNFPRLKYVEYTVCLRDFTQVRDLMGDGKVMKHILRKGKGDFPYDCPLEDTQVSAKIKCRAMKQSKQGEFQPLFSFPGAGTVSISDDERKQNSILTRFETGMGSVPPPVDAAIRVMLPGEIAQVTSDWNHAFGKIDWSIEDLDLDIAHGTDIEFEIELVDFIHRPAMLETPAEKVERSLLWREQGNTLFKAKRYILAKMKYMKGLRCVEKVFDAQTTEEAIAVENAKIACMSNLAACAQKLDEWGEAISWCDKVLR